MQVDNGCRGDMNMMVLRLLHKGLNSSCCSPRGPEFRPQDPHESGAAHRSSTVPTPGDPTPSSALCGRADLPGKSSPKAQRSLSNMVLLAEMRSTLSLEISPT